MGAALVRQPDRFVVRLQAAVEDVDGLRLVAVDLHGAVVHFAHGLQLDVVAVASRLPLPPHVVVKVLRHVLAEVVSVSLLKFA